MSRRSSKRVSKINPGARSAIAAWLRECRARSINVERVHPAVFYLVRNASGQPVASHVWNALGQLISQDLCPFCGRPLSPSTAMCLACATCDPSPLAHDRTPDAFADELTLAGR